METLTSQALPDVSNKVELAWDALPLEFAGMGSVEQWVRIPLRSSEAMVPARLDIGVDLINSGARGIHMSRLYLLAQRELSEQAFDQDTLRRLLS
jgi:GTP cyclohydrolase I